MTRVDYPSSVDDIFMKAFRPFIKVKTHHSQPGGSPDDVLSHNLMRITGEYKQLEHEYRTRLLHDPACSFHEGQKPENARRNRYRDVLPLDGTRVRLPVLPGHNDYINASWVKLQSTKASDKHNTKTYIACQGPTTSTVHDFWQMVHAYCGERISIVMLTPLQELRHGRMVTKCDKYWPDKYKELYISKDDQYEHDLVIRCIDTRSFGYYDINKLELVNMETAQKKQVTHYYFHSWLDFDIPQDGLSLPEFIRTVNETNGPESPLVVHCSAGIGRTGTYIALDFIYSCETQLELDLQPDYVYNLVDDMRKQRGFMVQQLSQYKYIYEQLVNLHRIH